MKFVLALSAVGVATAQLPYNRGFYNTGIYGRGARFGAGAFGRAGVRLGQPSAVTVAEEVEEVVAPRVITGARPRGVYGFGGIYGGGYRPIVNPVVPHHDAAHSTELKIAEHVITETEADLFNEINSQDTKSESAKHDTSVTMEKIAKDAAFHAAKLNHAAGDEASALDLKEAELEKAIADIEFFNVNSKLSKSEEDLINDLGWMVDDIDRQHAVLDLASAKAGGDASEIEKAEGEVAKESLHTYARLIELTDKNGKYTKSEKDILELSGDIGDLVDVIDDTAGRNDALDDLEAAKAAALTGGEVARLELEVKKHELTVATHDFLNSLNNYVTVSDNDDFWDMLALSEKIAEYEVAKLTKDLIHLGYNAKFAMNDDGEMMP